jgi:hypothetical protein
VVLGEAASRLRCQARRPDPADRRWRADLVDEIGTPSCEEESAMTQRLGAGTRVFEGVPPLKPEQVTSRAATSVTHVTYRVLS